MQIWPDSLKNRLKMYTFLRATKDRFEPVRTDSVACGFKRFFISEKPELQLTVRFFCGSVWFSCGFFLVVWTGPSNTNPGVFPGYPYPYPSLPGPGPWGTGLAGMGHGFFSMCHVSDTVWHVPLPWLALTLMPPPQVCFFLYFFRVFIYIN